MKQLFVFVFILAALPSRGDEPTRSRECISSLKRGETLTLVQLHAVFSAFAERGITMRLRLFQKRNPEYDALVASVLNMRVGMDYVYDSVLKHFKTVTQASKYFENFEGETDELNQGEPEVVSSELSDFTEHAEAQPEAHNPKPTTSPATESKTPEISPSLVKQILRGLKDRSYLPYGYFMLQPPAHANAVVARWAGREITTADVFHFMVSRNADYWKALVEMGFSPEFNLLRSRRRAADHYTPQELSYHLRRFQNELLTQSLSRTYWFTPYDLVILEAPTEDKALVETLLRILIDRPSRSMRILTTRVSDTLGQPVTQADVERAYDFLANNLSLLSFLGL